MSEERDGPLWRDSGSLGVTPQGKLGFTVRDYLARSGDHRGGELRPQIGDLGRPATYIQRSSELGQSSRVVLREVSSPRVIPFQERRLTLFRAVDAVLLRNFLGGGQVDLAGEGDVACLVAVEPSVRTRTPGEPQSPCSALTNRPPPGNVRRVSAHDGICQRTLRSSDVAVEPEASGTGITRLLFTTGTPKHPRCSILFDGRGLTGAFHLRNFPARFQVTSFNHFSYAEHSLGKIVARKELVESANTFRNSH